MRRPYRVYLPTAGRRRSFTTLANAVRACARDVDGVYVIERRDDQCGTHLPHTGLIAGGRVMWRGSWQQLREQVPA